jgi:hypothetical protein
VTRPRFATHGTKAEQGVAYEIEFHHGASPDVMTIHDLRIECDGRVAQIDHLIIHRFLDVRVCKSKFFSGGVEINESGEWSTHWVADLTAFRRPSRRTIGTVRWSPTSSPKGS